MHPKTTCPEPLQAISDLLTVPGASGTVLEALVPYATEATTALLGERPKSICSAETAALLAKRAYQRAAELTGPDDGPVIGIGCTAALCTVLPPKRCHVS
jgi:hypothetical protein